MAHPNVVVVVQARLGSTRLPGKVLKESNGKPLLLWQMERLGRLRPGAGLVIATTDKPADDAIVAFCRRHGFEFVRGPEDDVLTRFHIAAEHMRADVVVRVTADCPLIDPDVVQRCIDRLLESRGSLDYVSNTLKRSYPRGLDTEVMTFASLDTAFREARLDGEREHVTPFIYRHPERFRIQQIEHASDESAHRWTVDTPEDFELIDRLIGAAVARKRAADFTLDDLLAISREHPDWARINTHIEQKAH